MIFNSLGSNYSKAMVWQALFGSDRGSTQKLEEYLTKRYKAAKVVPTYKGREALQLAFQLSKLDRDSLVAINGFTCYAVYRSITYAGLGVEYLDIERSSLQFSAETLAKAVGKNPKIRAVVIQNTLGVPCDITAIEKICNHHKLILIEDLAHSVGIRYADGREAGTVGDFAMLSFGRDKLVDAVSGGALIINNPKLVPEGDLLALDPAPRAAVSRDRLYPLLTSLVRGGYRLGIGKVLHAGLRGVGLLSKSVDAEYYEGHKLPGWQARLALKQLLNLNTELTRRRNIAKIYRENLCQAALSEACINYSSSASNLRFPSFSVERKKLFGQLAREGIQISDTWYDVPIAPARYLAKTTYKHQCPVAEKISQEIINLPTHRHISEQTALRIAEVVNQCQP